MKITKGRLKTIIEEEIKAMREVVASDSMHGGPQMTSGGGSVLNAAAEALGMSPDELLRSIAAEYDVDIELEREDEDADPVDDMPEPMDDEPAGKSGEVDITPEIAAAVIELGDMLKGAMPEMAGDEDDMMGDEPADLPPPPAGDDDAEEPAMMEAEDANEEMNEEEMIQEVARRVAARILKAKNAKKELDEALGNK